MDSLNQAALAMKSSDRQGVYHQLVLEAGPISLTVLLILLAFSLVSWPIIFRL